MSGPEKNRVNGIVEAIPTMTDANIRDLLNDSSNKVRHEAGQALKGRKEAEKLWDRAFSESE